MLDDAELSPWTIGKQCAVGDETPNGFGHGDGIHGKCLCQRPEAGQAVTKAPLADGFAQRGLGLIGERDPAQ